MKKAFIGVVISLSLVGCAPAPKKGHAQKSLPSDTLLCSTAIECQDIGLSYAGRGDQESYAVASKYFQKSCDYGLSEGCNNLAFFYANARGVKQSYTLAYRYWGMACRMGNDSACANLELAKEKVAQMQKQKQVD